MPWIPADRAAVVLLPFASVTLVAAARPIPSVKDRFLSAYVVVLRICAGNCSCEQIPFSANKRRSRLVQEDGSRWLAQVIWEAFTLHLNFQNVRHSFWDMI